jgi:branched-chain amino acid transport system ATP-binding protein
LEAHSSADAKPVREDIVQATGIRAGYGRRQVLFDIALHVGVGEVVAMFGHNGAGKTTTLKSIYGQVRPGAGQIVFAGENVTRSPCARNVRRGMAFVAAEHFVFGELSVLDNLRLGAHLEPSRSIRQDRLKRVYETFPLLEERKAQAAGTMSGGQQRMLSLAMALISGPRLLLLDEPSLGLAPALAKTVLHHVRDLVEQQGMSVILLEQNVVSALELASRVYVMRSGRIILAEGSAELLAMGAERWWELF